MAGDQDRLAGLGAELDRSRNRMPISFDMGLVQKFHSHVVDLACFHGQANVGHQVKAVIKLCGQGLVGEGINLVGFLAQNPGVIGVGSVTFQAVHGNFANRMDVWIDREVLHAMQFAEFDLLID